jgi:hypothetical protein
MIRGRAGLAVRTATYRPTFVGWHWFHRSDPNLGGNDPGGNSFLLLVEGRLFLP